ncbi:MAG: UDP-N-acetylglucosamine 1-carboxyvinyltransferase [Patescibacteria group bacterium]|nr:UDP-N-acetylglucosamine 1-carboxyvinyltransferase [Patescibacteria group bacterium]
MEKLIIAGGRKLKGEIIPCGSKNVALKTLIAACLTDEEVRIENVPLISDLFANIDIIKGLGGKVKLNGHTVSVSLKKIATNKISLEEAARIRTSSIFLAPLLGRLGTALVPNPGGCRIGARPIDRTIEGLRAIGFNIFYNEKDGYFHAKIDKSGVFTNGKTVRYRFDKNTHTGTETLILASLLRKGVSILENAAQEPEIDELIEFVNGMGARVRRIGNRTIRIEGVAKLHGTVFRVSSDRNEIVTFAIAAVLTEGDIVIKEARCSHLSEFIGALEKAGGGVEYKDNGIRFYNKGDIKPTDVLTSFYPGFMTDWQAPWAVLMTKAKGVSTMHETIYENRFGYAGELLKMGAHIEFFNPPVKNPGKFYNFNFDDNKKEYFHAIRILGPSFLHNAVLEISDLRAGATLVLGALSARGTSVIFGVEHLDRGYEDFSKRLKKLGANIKRVSVD